MKVSCIIPAYNEATRVSNVIDIAKQHPMIGEVIVVNDASTDATQKILEKIEGIHLIQHEQNKGKTQAVLSGLSDSVFPFVLLLDADLRGLTEDALTQIIEPVLESKADITISLRKNALTVYRLLGIDFVSGERVFNKDLVLSNRIKFEHLPGFGLEVFINEIIIEKRLRLQIVPWAHVISPRKSAKVGFFLGSLGDIQMIRQVLATVPLSKCVYQIYSMHKLARR